MGRRRTPPPFPSRSAAMRAHATAPAGTGWINPDTLDLRAYARGDGNDGSNGRPNTTTNNNSNDDDGDLKVKHPSTSAVECLLIRDRLVYVKRDDALHLPSSNVSGNKARKFLSLNNLPAEEFPDAIVSFGGPQSNAMVALAAIVSSKNAELEEKEGDGSQREEPILSEGRMEGERDIFWQLDVQEEDGSDGKVGEKCNEDKNSTPDTSDNKPISLSNSSKSSSSPSLPNHNKQSPLPNDNKKLRFIYYTKTMPRYLRKNPNGNLLRALALGMELRTLSHEEYRRLFGGLHGGSALAPADLDPPVPGRSLWIPQGGACGIAAPGSDVLAKEIVEYWGARGRGAPLAVCVPGGTCATALLLHRSIERILGERARETDGAMDVRVVVIPCVGDDEYAMRQMASLDRSVGGTGRPEDLPSILRPRPDVRYASARRRSGGYFTFGEPAAAILQTHDEMSESGLFLDLLYGAPAWSLLLQHWRSEEAGCPIAGRQVMYVHSGGLEGIASQLTRYRHKGLLGARTIQTS